MFRNKKFRIIDLDELFRDIDEARTCFRRLRSIFLIDGNVLALKTDFLLKILNKITETFPEMEKSHFTRDSSTSGANRS